LTESCAVLLGENDPSGLGAISDQRSAFGLFSAVKHPFQADR